MSPTLIQVKHPGRTLVFVNAVSATRRLAALLSHLGLKAIALHASQQQRQRLKVMPKACILRISGKCC